MQPLDRRPAARASRVSRHARRGPCSNSAISVRHRIVAVEVEPVVLGAGQVEQLAQPADAVGAERARCRPPRRRARRGPATQLVVQHEGQDLAQVLQLDHRAGRGSRPAPWRRCSSVMQRAHRQAVRGLRAEVLEPVRAGLPRRSARATRRRRAARCPWSCTRTASPAGSQNSNWLAKNSSRRRTAGRAAAPRGSPACMRSSFALGEDDLRAARRSSGLHALPRCASSSSSRKRGLNASACTTTSMRSRSASITW